MEINREKYRAGENNYYGGRKNKKTQIIISFSLRKENYHLIRLGYKEFGESKKWPTFSISRNGEVFEHFNPDFYSEFIGIKNVDRSSISIVLENMGSLYKLGNGYFNWLNEKCFDENVINKRIFGGTYWESFKKKQLDSLIKLLKFLCEEYEIEKKIIDFHFYNADSKNFNGILFLSNYVEDSQNINPLLDILHLKEHLN